VAVRPGGRPVVHRQRHHRLPLASTFLPLRSSPETRRVRHPAPRARRRPHGSRAAPG
jgi:hypothetical protein